MFLLEILTNFTFNTLQYIWLGESPEGGALDASCGTPSRSPVSRGCGSDVSLEGCTDARFTELSPPLYVTVAISVRLVQERNKRKDTFNKEYNT